MHVNSFFTLSHQGPERKLRLKQGVTIFLMHVCKINMRVHNNNNVYNNNHMCSSCLSDSEDSDSL